MGEKVDISELTWEQREQVLRLLFSKINEATPTAKPRPLPPTSSLRFVLLECMQYNEKPQINDGPQWECVRVQHR